MLTEADRRRTLWESASEIIDSSALTKYAAKEPGWSDVEKYIPSGDSLELALQETSNALWKKIRKKEIGLETARKIVAILGETISFLDQRTYLDRALETASANSITVYEALFVACAEMENATLVSCDRRQLEVARELGIDTAEV